MSEQKLKSWDQWYAELAGMAGSVLLGRYGEALEFYERGISVSDAASAIAAGLTVEDYQEELDRVYLEAPEVGPEWPDLTGALVDEHERELERLSAEGLAALGADPNEDLEVAAAQAERDVADLGLRLREDREPAPRGRRPSMSARPYVGSSWSG